MITGIIALWSNYSLVLNGYELPGKDAAMIHVYCFLTLVIKAGEESITLHWVVDRY